VIAKAETENKNTLRPIGHYSSNDEKLKKDLNTANDLFIEQGQSEEFKISYKELCNKIRADLEESRVVGFAVLNNDDIAVLVYDIEATDENFYHQRFDEENQPYIEIQ
jgi:hypothetical protein